MSKPPWLRQKQPVVMGILNLTPDSFSDGGELVRVDDVLRRAERMVTDGGALLDLGAVSTRPGAPEVSEEEERGGCCLRSMPCCVRASGR